MEGNFAVMQDPADASRPVEPGCSLGPYLVLENLSSSRHAAVYLGHDVALDRTVVLKTAPPNAGPTELAALRHEARALARARNPYLVTLHALDDSGRAPVLVFEHLVGETLANRLARRGPLPVGAATELFIKLLTGLEHIHRAGVIHGHINPENIFLSTDGLPKFLGLQLAVFRDWPTAGPAARSPDLLYGAPEHRGTLPPDARADLFSLGLCLHEAITGTLPFEKKNRPGSRRRTLPPPLVSVLMRATCEDPEARFSSAVAFRHALNMAMQAGTRRRAGAAKRTRRLVRALAVDGALVAVLVGLVFALDLYPYAETTEQATAATETGDTKSRAARHTGNKTGQVGDKRDKYEALRRAWGD